MKQILRILLLLFLLNSCGNVKNTADEQKSATYPAADFVIAFGSCNKTELPQPLWSAMSSNEPDVFIWGGDNVYAVDRDLNGLKEHYEKQNRNKDYLDLKEKATVLATWDDHDYGLNDGGVEWERKSESQALFLDFLSVPEMDPRREQEGIYMSRVFETPKGKVKVMVLDTRYFRSPLLKSREEGKRYEISKGGTVLGKAQWDWLTRELSSSDADFNVLVSSIQVLAYEHGFESWGNFPSEVVKLKELITSSGAKNVLILSGDRHISEFSKDRLKGVKADLVDFTSSGLTHTYTSFTGEPNRYREKEVVKDLSFGLVFFDFDNNRIRMQMRGDGNVLQQELIQQF